MNNKKLISKLMCCALVVGLVFSKSKTFAIQAALPENTDTVSFGNQDECIQGIKTAEWTNDIQDVAKVSIDITVNKTSQSVDIMDKANIILVIDNSGSMLTKWDNSVGTSADLDTRIAFIKFAAKQLAASVLYKNPTNVQFGVVTFGNDSQSIIGGDSTNTLTNDIDVFNSAIDGIVTELGVGTNLQSAIYRTEQLLSANPCEKQIVIILSDGEPTYSYFADQYDSVNQIPISVINADYLLGDGTQFKISYVGESGTEYIGYTVDTDSGVLEIYDHGETTYAQAKLLKVDTNALIYTLGIGTPIDGDAKKVLYRIGMLNGGYENITDLKLLYSSLNNIIDMNGQSSVITQNTVHGITVTDCIPEGFNLDESIVDGTTIQYDRNTRTLTWNIGDVTIPDEGSSVTKTLSFDIKVDKSKYDKTVVHNNDDLIETNDSCTVIFDGKEDNTVRNPRLPLTFEEPTTTPTQEPTPAPTQNPTPTPTQEPTTIPTQNPTPVPTQNPTPTPTQEPTPIPTDVPTQAPTEAPTQTPPETPDEVDIVDDSIPQGTNDDSEIDEEYIDLEEDDIPEGTKELPKTGTLPIELFYGLGIGCIAAGRVILKSKKK